jgi:hypothetical protein
MNFFRDPLVHDRLREGSLIYLVVPVAPVADDVNNAILLESGTEVSCENDR